MFYHKQWKVNSVNDQVSNLPCPSIQSQKRRQFCSLGFFIFALWRSYLSGSGLGKMLNLLRFYELTVHLLFLTYMSAKSIPAIHWTQNYFDFSTKSNMLCQPQWMLLFQIAETFQIKDDMHILVFLHAAELSTLGRCPEIKCHKLKSLGLFLHLSLGLSML